MSCAFVASSLYHACFLEQCVYLILLIIFFWVYRVFLVGHQPILGLQISVSIDCFSCFIFVSFVVAIAWVPIWCKTHACFGMETYVAVVFMYGRICVFV